MHSFMLLRGGVVVAEAWWKPFAAEYPHLLWSLSKSFTSTAVGLAVSEGRLSVEDRVLSFFPADAPEQVSPNLAAMRVRDLLSMSAGHGEDTSQAFIDAPGDNWEKAFLAQPVDFPPGTHFLYNNGATYMLSAIVQKLTGQPLIDYLRPRLFEPLGTASPTWECSPRGVNVGWKGLSITTEDIASFGQLYLRRGVWNGRRILPESWVAAATSRQVPNGEDPNSDWCQGYGFQFWRCRHNGFRGDGAFGQFCLVLPDQDVVLAITSGEPDMQAELNLVWEHLLPALAAGPLPEDPSAQADLQHALARLAYAPLQQGVETPPLAAQVSGVEYHFDEDAFGASAARFDFDAAGCTVTLAGGLAAGSLRLGSGDWAEGHTALFHNGPRRVMACGAWVSADTYQVVLRFVETPATYTIRCCFTGSRVTLNATSHATFDLKEFPAVEGVADQQA